MDANEPWSPEFRSLDLAEKSGPLMPADAAARYETVQWLMVQMGSVGPMFGQVGFFHKFAGRDYEDKPRRGCPWAASA